MKKKYKVGMFGGKFMPFHKGHLYCLEVASNECEKVYCIMMHGGLQEQEIYAGEVPEYLSVENREKHARQVCSRFSNVIFYSLDAGTCIDENGEESWDLEMKLVNDTCGEPFDVIYGSELEYEEPYLKYNREAKYVVIDLDRKKFPISGTEIRNMTDMEEIKKWLA